MGQDEGRHAARSAIPLRISEGRYRYAGSREWVLEGVELEVREAEVVAVVGGNDSGKSTLGLVASGLAPTVIGGTLEGVVELGGRRTTELRPFEAAQQCGILFQNAANQLTGTAHTVWEELAFGPRNIGLDIDEVVDRVRSTLASLRIDDLAPRDPARLSGGQAQLVALAAVLTLQPRLLVLDEPTSQLDPEGTRLVGDAIRRLAHENGTGILLIEHKTGLLLDTADRGIALGAGQVQLAGPITALLEDASLDALGVDPPPVVRLKRSMASAGVAAASARRVVEAIAAGSVT
jgi:energy-coupling factor transport system ATP-binding protein